MISSKRKKLKNKNIDLVGVISQQRDFRVILIHLGCFLTIYKNGRTAIGDIYIYTF